MFDSIIKIYLSKVEKNIFITNSLSLDQYFMMTIEWHMMIICPVCLLLSCAICLCQGIRVINHATGMLSSKAQGVPYQFFPPTRQRGKKKKIHLKHIINSSLFVRITLFISITLFRGTDNTPDNSLG